MLQFSVIFEKKKTECSFSIFFLLSLVMYIFLPGNGQRKWGKRKIKYNINMCLTMFIVTIVI